LHEAIVGAVEVDGYGSTCLYPFRVALQRLCNVADPIERAAYEQAMNGIIALVTKHRAALTNARDWSARRRGYDDPDSQALAVVEIAGHVAVAAWLRKRVGEATWGTAPNTAGADLHACLVARHGTRVPSAEDLTEWIDRHGEHAARGVLTTGGIVARIVHRAKLLGARGSDESKTLQRVDKILSRHAKANARRCVSSDNATLAQQPRGHEHDSKRSARAAEADTNGRAPRRRRGRMRSEDRPPIPRR
jgi:hypothetical protein